MAEFIIGSPLRKIARQRPWLQRTLWRLDHALVWLLVKLFSLLPVDFASRVGQRVGGWIGPRLKRKSAIFRDNLRTAFPELSDFEIDQLLVEAWGRAGRILAEYPHLEQIMREEGRLEIDIRERIPTYDDPSKPCVVVTAHVSNWEVVGAAMGRLGIPNACLYTPPTNPYLDRMLADSRKALNCELLPRDNGARLLMRALKQGRTAGIVADRRVDEGKPIVFFGRDKLSTLMPAKLALKFDCELVPAQVERLDDARYRVTFHEPVKPSDPQADENAQAADMTTRVHRHYENWVRQHPEDWFCSKRLWDKRKKSAGSKPSAAETGIEKDAA